MLPRHYGFSTRPPFSLCNWVSFRNRVRSPDDSIQPQTITWTTGSDYQLNHETKM